MNRPLKITRRKLAMLAAAAPLASVAIPCVAIGAEGQTLAADSDEETRSAHELLRNNAQALAKVKMPMSTEPAVHFKA
jgi:hypothetical protein